MAWAEAQQHFDGYLRRKWLRLGGSDSVAESQTELLEVSARVGDSHGLALLLSAGACETGRAHGESWWAGLARKVRGKRESALEAACQVQRRSDPLIRALF